MRTFETKSQIGASTLLEGDLVQILGTSREGDTVPKLGRVRQANHPTINEMIELANGLFVEVFPAALANAGGDTIAGSIVVQPTQIADGTQVKFASPHADPDAVETSFTVAADGFTQTPIDAWHVYEPHFIEFHEAPPAGTKVVVTYLSFVDMDYAVTNALVQATGAPTPRSVADRLADELHLKDFDVVGDGIADDTDAIQAALDLAESTGVRLVGNGTYRVRAGVLSTTAKFDFRDAEFHVYDGATGATVLSINSDHAYENVTGELDIAELVQGKMYLPSLDAHRGKRIKIYSEELDLLRSSGAKDADGNPQPQQPQYKKEVNVMNKYSSGNAGWLQYPIIYDYASVTAVYVQELDEARWYGLPKIYCYSTDKLTLVRNKRSNVTLLGGQYIEGSRADADSQPVTQGISFSDCHNVLIDGFVSEYFSNPGTAYGYTVIGTYASHINVKNINATGSWAAFDGNYMRDLTIQDSIGSRFGGHCSVWDIRYVNCISERGFQGMGGGIMSLVNCSLTVENVLVSIRGDYAARWRGDIYITNCNLMGQEGFTWDWGHRFIDATITETPEEPFNSSEPMGITGSVFIDGVVMPRKTKESSAVYGRFGNLTNDPTVGQYNFPSIVKMSNMTFTEKPALDYRCMGGPQASGLKVVFENCTFDPTYGVVGPIMTNTAYTPDTNNIQSWPSVVLDKCHGVTLDLRNRRKHVSVLNSTVHGYIGSEQITRPYTVNYVNCDLHAGHYAKQNVGNSFNGCRIHEDGVDFHASGQLGANWISNCFVPDNIAFKKSYTAPDGTNPYVGSVINRQVWVTGKPVNGIISHKCQGSYGLGIGAYYATNAGLLFKCVAIDPTVYTHVAVPPEFEAGFNYGYGAICTSEGNLYIRSSSGSGTTKPTPVPEYFTRTADSWNYVGPYTGIAGTFSSSLQYVVRNRTEKSTFTEEGVTFVYVDDLNTDSV